MVNKDIHSTGALRCLSRSFLASVLAVVRMVLGYTHLTVGVDGGSPDMSGGRVTRPYEQATSSAKRGGLLIWDFCVLLLLVIIISTVTLPSSASAATPPGTNINNTATATYDFGSNPGLTSNSNTVTTTTVVTRTPSTLTILKYAPGVGGAVATNVATTDFSTSATVGGPFLALGAPNDLAGAPINLAAAIDLLDAPLLHQGEALFLELTDIDQNLNALAAETIFITLTTAPGGDTEVLRLTETGIDTGVFTGYIQTSSAAVAVGNGALEVTIDATITASYTDVADGADLSTDTALVDPYGLVFDSATGLSVDGALVTLIDVGTGLPATTIKGDDGVSAFPATVTSGGTVTDGGGTIYNFPAGGFRFPFLAVGTYRLEVTPPLGYTAPSTVPTATLQALPGAPFSIVAPGSRNEDFVINPGPALHIDLPIDPLATNSLFVRKTASKTSAAIGDFLQYRISVENTTAAALTPVTVTDRLPLGMRYRDGSTSIDNTYGADPAISSDGRTITFTITTLTAGQTKDIKYVVEVSSGTAIGSAVNIATATSGAITSNTARAEVKIKEDLMRSQTIIMGRVSSGPCDEEDDNKITGVKGARIYLEDGTYVVTDAKGYFHIEGVRPGAHVVQLDKDTLPFSYTTVLCEDNSRFAGRSFSQFVDIAKGGMWRADFRLSLIPKETGDVSTELKSKIVDNLVKYTLPIRIGSVPLTNLKATIILPEDTTYEKGSSTINGEETGDPDIMNDNVLTYRIAAATANSEVNISFSSSVGVPEVITNDPDKDNTLVTKAYLLFDTPSDKGVRTPVIDNSLMRYFNEDRVMNPAIALHPHFDVLGANLSAEDKLAIDDVIDRLRESDVLHIYVTGHTDSMQIKKRSRKVFKNNQVLSLARAKSVARYIADELKLSASQVTLSGKGPDIPVASNETTEGRSENRRVELTVLSRRLMKYAYLIPVKEQSDIILLKTTGLRPGETPTETATNKIKDEVKDLPAYKAFPVEEAAPGFEILWPTRKDYPPMPGTKVTIKHAPKSNYKLFMNGKEVSPLHLEGTTQNTAESVALSYWRGVDLKEGDNLLEAVLYDEDAVELERVSSTVHYSSPPTNIALVKEESNLIVDGLTPPMVAVRFTDKDGEPARAGVTGEFTVDPPHAALQSVKAFEEYPLSGIETKRTKFIIGADGIAQIRLRPDSTQGGVTIRFNLISGEQVVKPWLKPKLRDWILVGFAEGTAGYNTIDDNMESAKISGAEDDFYEDGRTAFFAKGTIKGQWLLTMAYDSKKDGFDEDNLHGTIDPGTYYTIYGDKTDQRYEAQSNRKLYLKVERQEFYTLFGDFNTGLDVTELSRYKRSMNGLKSEMRGEKFSYTAFVADTNKAFVKDELRGDGTSGLYTLSRSNIVTNSESVTIEVRDRFRSEVIISKQRLARHTDYDIDYDTSTIFFKEPVLSKDRDMNPVYIVVDYESADSNDKSYNYGGRAEAKLLEGRVTAGVTHVHEGRLGGEGDLYGMDASVKVSDNLDLKLETSKTRSDFGGTTRDDSAYIAELSHRLGNTSTNAYIREYGEDFGLGQNMGSENGTRKFGVNSSHRLTKRISINGELMRQENLLTNARRSLTEFGLKYRADNYSLNGGLRTVADKLGDGSTSNSKQLTLGAEWQPIAERLRLRITHEQSILGDDESSDYPTRTTIGADLKINRFVTVFADQEFTYGDAEDTQSTRVGLKATPWKGANLKTSIVRDYNEYGERVFSNVGLAQRLRLTERLSINASIDSANSIKHPGNTPMNTNVPLASADSEFTALSAGVGYQGTNWGATSRIETRTSRYEDKLGVFTGVSGELKEGLGLSAGLKLTNINSSAVGGADKDLRELRLGFAYRPLKSRWIVLNRLELITEEADGGDFNYDNRRIVNNTNANFKVDSKTQISLQYGAKYVRDTIDNKSYSGYTDLIGVEARYDITPKWDVGARTSVLHSWESSQIDYGTGFSIGHSFTENTWVSFGYNITGFKDNDFSGSNFTAKGPFMNFRIKFDQESVREAVKRLSGD